MVLGSDRTKARLAVAKETVIVKQQTVIVKQLAARRQLAVLFFLFEGVVWVLLSTRSLRSM